MRKEVLKVHKEHLCSQEIYYVPNINFVRIIIEVSSSCAVAGNKSDFSGDSIGNVFH